MAENEISDYFEVDESNVDIAGITVQENVMKPSNVNNAFRALQGALKRFFRTNLFRLRDSADQTKLVAFDASPLTTATTRTFAFPDYPGYLSVSAKGADMPSAGTISLGVASGDFVHVTGTATITSLGTGQAGLERTLVFDGALTLTHNSVSLILPGAANILTLPGDTATFRSEGASGWRLVNYERNAQFLSGNLTGTGYMRLPNGVIVQWGNFTATGGAAFLTFPTGFPTAVFTVVGTALATVDINCTSDSTSVSGTNFRTWNTAGVATGSNVRWVAIGI